MADFRNKALSPLIVIGTEHFESFIKRNPVFSVYSDEHAYFQIPFELIALIDKLSQMKPIYDHEIRRRIVADYSHDYGYKLITHDLKIIQGDKRATIDNLSQVKDFLISEGNFDLVQIIDGKLMEIQYSPDWEEIALDIRSYLIEKMVTKK